jgi:hypothetical protein
MATKALNYTTAEINRRLNLAGTAVQPSDLNEYYTKTEINSMIGDINSALDTINGEVI